MYLTKIEPKCGKEAIIRNNYDGSSESFIRQKLTEGKADVGIELHLPAEEVRKCNVHRNVYVYPDDINLMQNFEGGKLIYIGENDERSLASVMFG